MDNVLISAIRQYALEHYADKDFRWDVIVESWSDEDIANEIGKARTLAGALRKVRPSVREIHT